MCMFRKMYFLTDYSPGMTVSCCVHLWLLLSYKMHFVCSLQAGWCHGPWCSMLCTPVVVALLQNALCMFSAGRLVSWGLVLHAVHTGGGCSLTKCTLYVLCRPAGVIGPGVPCCAHRWLLLSYKMYFILCRLAGVMGPGVSCCAHRWWLLSYKMHFVCSLQAGWCHGAWCFTGPRRYQ